MMKVFNLYINFIVLLIVNTTICCYAFTTKYHHHRRPSFSRTQLYGKSVLIIQNKGGGHGEIGYQLVKTILEDEKYNNIDTITILQDDTCKRTNEPFQSYDNDFISNNKSLNQKVNIIYAPLNDDTIINEQYLRSILLDQTYHYVYDNVSKNDQGFGKVIIDLLCTDNYRNTLQLLCYISSGGMYNPSKDHGRNPLKEDTTPIKITSGQHLYDQYVISKSLPYCSFRPQYIYGPKSNKFDYIDYFFDRLVRNLPVPVPYDGEQLVSLTNVKDVATILLLPINNDNIMNNANKQRFFNCGTDQLISYNDLVYLCANVAGILKDNVKIEYYDPEFLGTKGDFPFRMTDFYIVPDIAKEILLWSGIDPNNSLEQDLIWYYNDYKNKRNGLTKQMSLVKDWEIVIGCKTTLPEYSGSIYDQYDPLILQVEGMKEEK